MSEKMVERLKEQHFKYYYGHVSFEGKHHDTKKQFELVYQFLDEHFQSN
jgi:hypothetical protein